MEKIQQHQTRHRDKSSKTNEVFFKVHSDSVSNQLNQKMKKIPVSSADCNDETILEMSKTYPMGQLSSSIIMDGPGPIKTCQRKNSHCRRYFKSQGRPIKPKKMCKMGQAMARY